MTESNANAVVQEAPAVAPADATLAVDVPKLQDAEAEAKALELSKKIGDKTADVLTLGETWQNKVSSGADAMMNGMTLKDAGEAGALLKQVEETMKTLDPNILRDTKKVIRKFWILRKVVDATDEVVDGFMSQVKTVEGTLNGIAQRLEQEKVKAFQGITTMEMLREDIDTYKKALLITIRGAAIKFEAVKAAHAKKQAEAAASGDQSVAGEVQALWDHMELLHQRIYSLRMALALAENTVHESRQVGKVLTASANALQEARTLGITAWKQQITITRSLLLAKTQMEAVTSFRQLTDQMIANNTRLLGETDDMVGNLQKRAFVAADALVNANNGLAEIIRKAKARDEEAQKQRAEMFAKVQASQKNLNDALVGSKLEHLKPVGIDAVVAGAPAKAAESTDPAKDLLTP